MPSYLKESDWEDDVKFVVKDISIEASSINPVKISKIIKDNYYKRDADLCYNIKDKNQCCNTISSLDSSLNSPCVVPKKGKWNNRQLKKKMRAKGNKTRFKNRRK